MKNQMTKLLRIRGTTDDIYYVNCFGDETIADISELICSKYDLIRENTALRKGDDVLSGEMFIRDLNFNQNEFLYITLPVAKNMEVRSFKSSNPTSVTASATASATNSGQIPNKSGATNSNEPQKLTKKEQKIVDLIQELGISSKKKIVDAMKKNKNKKLETAVYLIESEQGQRELSNFQKTDQSRIKKLMKKSELPLSIVAFVYFGNSKDQKKTAEILENFNEN